MSDAIDFAAQGPVRGATVDYVMQHLRDGIVEGRYAPGQRLIEADLTRELGVSRGPLREALRRLSADNLLEIVPNRGAIVRRLSMREMLELFSIRIALESHAAREATRMLATPGVRARFEADIQPIWLDRPRLADPNYINENRSFHEAIIRATGNERLMALTIQMQLTLLMFQLNGALTADSIATSVVEHRAIATAMLDGDPEAAATQARTHLERARNLAENMPSKVFGNGTRVARL
ncbi:GntR family transcriptional regulator [Bosea sp. AS-1]|jgi:DNA-binding GntR family transcriptional regulator|uniref:GntR family transcriptional regulator n=1 Tax=Bosea sp. AS-1 TaxID=2015316 RepID=UPI000B79215C|nr:GntR family transcriptional regulator [Bosea sp. AS-1]